MSVSSGVAGGYKTVSVIQLCNGLSALISRLISFQAFRVYIACFELVAVREAAERIRKKERGVGKKEVRYRVEEIQRLVGGKECQLRAILKRLEKLNLLAFSESYISMTETPLTFATDFISKVSPNRKPTRKIPIPRRLIRLMAKSNKPALVKTLIAFLIRGLSWNQRTRQIKNSGRVKVSWIVEILGVSESAVRISKRELLECGVLIDGDNSSQRVLNQRGAYFLINLWWGNMKDTSIEETENAPPMPQKVGKNVPPYKDSKTLSDLKDQKTAEHGSGFLKEKNKSPNFKNIKLDDLKSLPRLESLYFQAVEAGWLDRSEANVQFFVACAVRSRYSKGIHDPVRAFVWLVKQQKRLYITHEYEAYALKHLRAYRAKYPAAFSVDCSKGEESVARNAKGKVDQLLRDLLGKMVA